jgi:peptide-methionine (S)-S-oxide reductase
MEHAMIEASSTFRRIRQVLAGTGLIAAVALAWPARHTAAESAKLVPAPAMDEAPGKAVSETAVFAGGCFWGVQGVFEHVKGVTRAVSGYAGGHVANPGYEAVSSGATGHAESVSVTFDPRQISYGELLRIFFSVTLDPTEVDKQGPDRGTQYRSLLLVNGAEQERVARAYIAQLDAAHVFGAPIATRVEAAESFWPAEAYHQDYLEHHPDAPYIVIYDQPKVRALRTLFPDRWHAEPALVVRTVGN